MNKKPILIFTTCDANNFPTAVKMLNSLVKFHDTKNVDIRCITNFDPKLASEQLPKGVILESLTPYIKDDPIFFYRQKPIVMDKYIDEYECVLGLDADQVILGDLSYIWEKAKDYDVATVINWNRADVAKYGFVELMRIGIQPIEYFNCGLVAVRSKKFTHNWLVDCFSKNFEFCQYKEQDILNILCYFGNYNVRCLDHGDKPAGMTAWWGLISKGEWSRTILKDNKVIVPKGEGDTPFPPEDMELKVIHMAGGGMEKKDNWGIYFPEEVYKRIQYLISP